MKITKIPIPIYFGTLRIVITDDFKYTSDKLKINHNGQDPDEYGAFVDISGWGRGLEMFTVFFRPNPENALIAHEVVHLVNAIFIGRNVKLDPHNDEAQAYLTGWITQQIYKILSK